MSQRYFNSEEMLKRALEVIPLGTQTFSKSKTQYPFGVSPYYVKKGMGSRIWDVDGNEYIDFVNGLAAVTLGYNDPDVTEAVQRQLEDGAIFSLPHPIEIEVAEKIIESVPCAEMVRFGKNGSDATSGAIRLARAYTDRDHVVVCGYHGWQDWFIGSTSMSRGVPKQTRELTHTFDYNDLESLEKVFRALPGQVAAVIMEPMNIDWPKPGFLQEIQELTHDRGALFILDETITGFRFANGGAQEYFGIMPDLATFGKGLANGYPVSAIAGRKDVMQLMEEVFFSFTFGGDTLSLAAARASMIKLQREPVIETLAARGSQLTDGLNEQITELELAETVKISGHPSWSFITFRDTEGYSQWEIKTLFLQEMFARGILILGTHNMSYAHSEKDIDTTLAVYSEVLRLLKTALSRNDLRKLLRCETLKPLFRVR